MGHSLAMVFQQLRSLGPGVPKDAGLHMHKTMLSRLHPVLGVGSAVLVSRRADFHFWPGILDS